MGSLIGILLVGSTLVLFIALIRLSFGLAWGVAAPTAFGLLVLAEGLTLRGLSMFHAVSRGPLLVAHLLAIGALAFSLRADFGRRLVPLSPRSQLLSLLPGAPLLLLLLVSAVRWAPNNFDGMYYHLTRVAHWIGEHSVAFYFTPNPLQNTLPPGAEYLLLVLQVLSGSDHCAAFVQLIAWVCLVFAAAPLARAAGAPAWIARWAWIVPATLPMGVLQAPSVQNDLVAAVATLGTVPALQPWFGDPDLRPLRVRDSLLLGASFAATLVVKPTAALAALPLGLLAAFHVGNFAIRRSNVRLAALAVLAVLTGVLLTAPELGRYHALAGQGTLVAGYSYPLLSEWKDRAINVVRSWARNAPIPAAVADPLRLASCPKSGWCMFPTLPNEDLAGNPLHAALVLLAIPAVVLRWRALPPRTRVLAVLPASSLVLFAFVFRDNPFITRLQLPSFALSPFILGILHGIRPRPFIRLGLSAVATLSIVLSLWFAVSNVRRPPLARAPSRWVDGYYAGRAAIALAHERALEQAATRGCDRLAVLVGTEYSCEYPLIWRARQRSVATRYLVRPDDPWPCLVYRDPDLPVPSGWIDLNVPGTRVLVRAVPK